jgi:hypothetical protein
MHQAAPASCPHLDQRERRVDGADQTALACCEGLTYYDLLRFPPLHAPLAEHFSRKQMAEIAATAINTTFWTCLRQELDAIPMVTYFTRRLQRLMRPRT